MAREGLNRIYNQISTLGKTFYNDARASHAWKKSAIVASNGIAKSKEIVTDANALGRDALFTARRTVGASTFDKRSLISSTAIGAGVGAVGNAGMAYARGDDDYGRAGLRGAAFGATAGLAFGAGSSLSRGYKSQATSRMSRYSSFAGPQVAPVIGPKFGPKGPGMGYQMKKRLYGSGLLSGMGAS